MLNKFFHEKRYTILLCVVLFFFVLLRIPSLFEPHWYNDEGIFANNGIQILRGAKLYIDVWDHKPPFIFSVFTISELLGNVLFYSKIVNSLSIIAAFLGVWNILKNRVSFSILSIVSFISLFLFNSYFFESNIVTPENFIILFTTWGLYFWLEKKFFISGVFFGLGGLFKPNAWIEGGIFCLVLLGIEKTNLLTEIYRNVSFKEYISKFKIIFRKYIIFALGMFGIISLSFIPFLAIGTVSQYFGSVIISNISYVSSSTSILDSLPIVLSMNILTFVTLGVYLNRKKIPIEYIAFFSAGLAGFLLSKKLYNHYYIELIPSFVIVFSIFLKYFIWRYNYRIRIGILSASTLLLLSFFYLFSFSSISIDWGRFSYWTNYTKYINKEISYHEYMHAFWLYNAGPNDIYSVSEFVRTKYGGEYSYYVGNNSWFYILSETKNASPYVVYYHNWFNGRFRGDETMKYLETNKPKVIVMVENFEVFEELDKFISNYYQKDLNYINNDFIVLFRK